MASSPLTIATLVPAFRRIDPLTTTSFIRQVRYTSSFKPKPVKKIYHEDLTADSLLKQHLESEKPEALHIVRKQLDAAPSLSLMQVLQEDPDAQRCIVELEVGRYDKDVEKFQLPLLQYLDWLQDSARHGGRMNGKQVYLAQWHGVDDVPGLQDAFAAPSFLTELFKRKLADLYQVAFFVGAQGAVTPLHYDPYINLFTLIDSNDAEAAKHFTIFPPNTQTSGILRRDEDSHLRNTSPIDLVLDAALPDGELSIRLSDSSPAHLQTDLLAAHAYGVTLRRGEMLLLPLRWWHRVQNIGPAGSWTAGVGHWFRTKTMDVRQQVPPATGC